MYLRGNKQQNHSRLLEAFSIGTLHVVAAFQGHGCNRADRMIYATQPCSLPMLSTRPQAGHCLPERRFLAVSSCGLSYFCMRTIHIFHVTYNYIHSHIPRHSSMYTPSTHLLHSSLPALSQDSILFTKCSSNTLPTVPSSTPSQYLLSKLRTRFWVHRAAVCPLEDVPPNLACNCTIEQVRVIRRTVAEQMPEETLPAGTRGLRNGRVLAPDVMVDFGAFARASWGPLERQR